MTAWNIGAGIGIGSNFGLSASVNYGSDGRSWSLGGYYDSRDVAPKYDEEDHLFRDPYSNCYATDREYDAFCEDELLGDFNGHDPGYYKERKEPSYYYATSYDIDKIISSAISDGNIKKPNFWNKLGFGKTGYYSVYLVVDNTQPKIDYHWYRQDKGLLWSSQHGGGGNISRKDGLGLPVLHPFLANHKYSSDLK